MDYASYFENIHGEQSIFTYDRATGRGVLWMGDAGWENEYEVVHGNVSELILENSEWLWLLACWYAATGTDLVGQLGEA